jgi:hypothetical protein
LARISSFAVLLRIALFAVFLSCAFIAGSYLGKKSVPEMPSLTALPAHQDTLPEGGEQSGEHALPLLHSSAQAPQLFFFAGKASDDVWPVVAEEVTLAKEAGISNYVVPVALDWSEPYQPEKASAIEKQLQQYLDINSRAQLLLWINLNPPASWLTLYPDAALRFQSGLQAYPSIGSELWRNRALEILAGEIDKLEKSGLADHIRGYVLGALGEQRWRLPGEHDLSEANQSAFRRWLQNHYGTEEELAKAWGVDAQTFDRCAVPVFSQQEGQEKQAPVFLVLPQMQPMMDYYRYCSDQVADTLISAVTRIKEIARDNVLVLAPYGFTYELTEPSSGHYALERLLHSDLDGVILPVSYVDRGLGGTGGPVGPVDSLLARGKTCFIMDDTRTGVERDESTGLFGRVKGIRPDDIFEVQKRNFALALSCGMGLIWTDPESQGWLNIPDQWKQFARLKTLYADYQNKELQGQTPESPATLTVVVDERANFCLASGDRINNALLLKGREMALRAGVSTRFHLLKDVVDGVAPPSPVYLFLNPFMITEEERNLLHARLAGEEACAIWLYAPGYFGAESGMEGMSRLVGMDIQPFKEPASGESVYILSGLYMPPDQPFGSKTLWNPLFFIPPHDDLDLLAHYTSDKDKGSIAIRTFPENWTSLFIATPELSPALLRELMVLLEQPILTNDAEDIWYDTVYARNNLMTIHSNQAGRRSFSFGQYYDIEDLFDSSMSWFQKDTILLTMRTGETRVLQKKIIETEKR